MFPDLIPLYVLLQSVQTVKVIRLSDFAGDGLASLN